MGRFEQTLIGKKVIVPSMGFISKVVLIVAAIWTFVDVYLDVGTIFVTYKPKCYRTEGTSVCGYFYAGLTSLFGPPVLMVIIRLIFDIYKQELGWDTLKSSSVYILYPLTFPFANMYMAIQEVRGKTKESEKSLTSVVKLAEVLGESVPQAIIATIWLIHRGEYDSCLTTVKYCHARVVPIVSLIFSIGSIIYGMVKGSLGLRRHFCS